MGSSIAKKAHFISGMLVFGTCTSILMKVNYLFMYEKTCLFINIK